MGDALWPKQASQLVKLNLGLNEGKDLIFYKHPLKGHVYNGVYSDSTIRARNIFETRFPGLKTCIHAVTHEHFQTFGIFVVVYEKGSELFDRFFFSEIDLDAFAVVSKNPYEIEHEVSKRIKQALSEIEAHFTGG